MGHTPYGYRIENGIAVIDAAAAGKLRKLYENYLSGMSLQTAAKEAGIDAYHCTAKRLLMTRHYLGDDFYPAIIDGVTFNQAQDEISKRAARLGRLNRAKKEPSFPAPTLFTIGEIRESYDNHATQAEYLYSLIECEVR